MHVKPYVNTCSYENSYQPHCNSVHTQTLAKSLNASKSKRVEDRRRIRREWSSDSLLSSTTYANSDNENATRSVSSQESRRRGVDDGASAKKGRSSMYFCLKGMSSVLRACLLCISILYL